MHINQYIVQTKRMLKAQHQIKNINYTLNSFMNNYNSLIQLQGKLYEEIHLLNIYGATNTGLPKDMLDCYRHVGKFAGIDKDNHNSAFLAILAIVNLTKRLDLLAKSNSHTLAHNNK